MSHGLVEMARDALALFQKTFFCNISQEQYLDPDAHSYLYRPTSSTSGGWPHLLTDVPQEDLARISFPVMFELEKAQTRVLLHGVKWVDEAKTVKVSPVIAFSTSSDHTG